MELIHILQLCFIFIIFSLMLIFVLLPLKLVPTDPQQVSSRRTQRVLDLCHSFSCGIFLGTCFVQLVPHAEATMSLAFGAGDLPMTYSPLLTQLVCMLGFFVVLFVDRAVEMCRGTRQTTRKTTRSSLDDAHELATVKGYIVTVSSSEGTGSEDDSEVELMQERDSMLNTGGKGPTSRGKDRAAPKRKRSNRSRAKSPDVNGTSVAHLSGGDAATLTAHGHSRLVPPVIHEELNLRCIILLLALSLHNLFEGIAVGLQETILQLTGLTVGITVHSCLVAFALGMALTSHNGMLRGTVVRFGVIYSAMIPIGVGIGMGVGTVHGFIGRLVSGILQSITAGTFIYVIFVEILPHETDRNRDRLLKVAVMFGGFIIIGCMRFVTLMVH